LRVVLECLLG